MSLKSFFRLLRTNRPLDPASGVDDSLARTAKDTMHVRGRGAGSVVDGGAYSGTEAVYKQIAKGHKNYAKSFKKKDG